MPNKCKPSDVECLKGMAQSELFYQAMAKTKASSAGKSAEIHQLQSRLKKPVQSDHARRVAPLAVATGR